jgi:hypothetical protein
MRLSTGRPRKDYKLIQCALKTQATKPTLKFYGTEEQ